MNQKIKVRNPFKIYKYINKNHIQMGRKLDEYEEVDENRYCNFCGEKRPLYKLGKAKVCSVCIRNHNRKDSN